MFKTYNCVVLLLCLQIYRLLLQGNLDKVQYLLSLNAAFRTDAFQNMNDVLRKMPVFNVSQNLCASFQHVFLTRKFDRVSYLCRVIWLTVLVWFGYDWTFFLMLKYEVWTHGHNSSLLYQTNLTVHIRVFQQLFRGNSLSEFGMKWRHWRDNCERRLEAGEFSTVPNIEIMAKVGKVSYILCNCHDVSAALNAVNIDSRSRGIHCYV